MMGKVYRYASATVLIIIILSFFVLVPTAMATPVTGSDYWMDPLSDGSGLSTSTNIVITDGKARLAGISGTEILRPNGPGSEKSIVYPEGETHWNLVDEEAADDDTTFIYQRYSSNSMVWGRDLFSATDHSSGSGQINSVTIHYRVKWYVNQLRDAWARASIRTNGSSYDGTIYQISPYNTWVNYSEEWTTNPVTGNPWTWAEIDALEIGVSLRMEYSWFLGSASGCTQVFAEVDYGSGVTSGDMTSVAISPSGSGASWGTFSASHTIPSGTNIAYKVLDASDNSVLCTISASQAQAGYAISSCAGAADSIKLKAELDTGGTSFSPSLDEWQVTWIPDTTAPQISDVEATVIDTSSATITWTTNENADSVIRYGQTTSLGQVESSSALVTSHQIIITGLDENTMYYFQVESSDESDNLTIDNNGGSYYIFTTAESQDITPPVISGVGTSGISGSSATVSWSTDESSDSVVRYGISTSLSSVTSSDILTISHSLQLSGLSSGTTYYFEVESTDASDNTSIDNNSGMYYTFTTTTEADTTPPVITSVQSINITDTSATITWNTDEIADSIVTYGNSTGLGSTAFDSVLTTNHSIPLTGLVEGTAYYYQVESTDSANNTSIDNNGGLYYSFVAELQPDTTPPVISNVLATNLTPTSANIVWNTNENADSVVRYGNTTALGSIALDNSLVTDHSVVLNGLTPDTLYYYLIESTDASDNTAIDSNGGLYYTFTPTESDTTPPIISAVEATNLSDNAATIIWTTDELADSTVRYGTNQTLLEYQVSESSLVINHSLSLTGLMSAKTYYYEVESTDSSYNTAVDDNNGSFYTLVPPDTTPPIISNIQAGNITVTSAMITWSTNEEATSVVIFGNATGPDLTSANSTLTLDHRIILANLTAGRTYFYEVQSADASNNTATDDNSGSYYSFTTPIQIDMVGWGWCTDYTKIADIELSSLWTLTPREDVSDVHDMHMTGTLTLTPSNSTMEIIPLEMYGTKVRSLFHVEQQEAGQSANLGGLWLGWTGGQYVTSLGELVLPGGEVFKTGRLYILQLDTPDVEIQEREPGNFVANIEYLLTQLAKLLDSLIDELMLTDFATILGAILTKLMVLLAAIRDLGIPYIP